MGFRFIWIGFALDMREFRHLFDLSKLINDYKVIKYGLD